MMCRLAGWVTWLSHLKRVPELEWQIVRCHAILESLHTDTRDSYTSLYGTPTGIPRKEKIRQISSSDELDFGLAYTLELE